jgi:molybdate transport system substrate-binding protein
VRIKTSILIALIFLWGFPAAASEGKLLVAVAANFMAPFTEIAAAFEKESGCRVEPVFSSTGKLYAQIINNAPYDMFLAADKQRPGLLFKDGLCEEPFVYARGEIVLFSQQSDFCARFADWTEAVRSDAVEKIAIANPETAPYGAAAVAALKEAGLFESLQGKYVFPQDIGQAFQYASTGSVQAGFCALSSALTDEGKKGCYFPVKQAPQVVQAACILKRTQNREAAQKLAEFLSAQGGVMIKEKYGYR